MSTIGDDGKERSPNVDLNEALQGKTLRVYLTLLDSQEPLGPREIQRRLEYSSVNVAVHHLEKLCRLGLIVKDDYGKYFVAKRVNIGIMELFINVGRVRFPRLLFYAAFFAAFLVTYLVTAPIIIERDSAYVIVLAISGTVLLAYEAFKVWRQIS